jgi:hypothetical protein
MVPVSMSELVDKVLEENPEMPPVDIKCAALSLASRELVHLTDSWQFQSKSQHEQATLNDLPFGPTGIPGPTYH